MLLRLCASQPPLEHMTEKARLLKDIFYPYVDGELCFVQPLSTFLAFEQPANTDNVRSLLLTLTTIPCQCGR